MAQKIAGGKTRSLPGSEPRVTCHHELAEEVLVDEHDELITKPRKRRKMDSSTPDPLPEDLITLDDEPSETQLMSVSKEVGGKWKAVLVYLEIKKNKIDSILQTAFGNVENACFDGLVYWRNGNASKPVTWRTLFQSLREAGLEEETEGLKKMFNIPLDAAEDMEQEGLTEHGVTMQKVSSRCNKHLRERYRNQKVEDTWLNAGNPVHIRPTFLGAKTNIRNEEDTPNVSDVAKGTGKETYYFPIEITDVLTFNVDRKDRKVVLIEGAPGSGKSTTARYLCRLWAEGRIGEEYNIFIIIPLRALNNTDCSDFSDLLRFLFPESLKEAAKKEISAHYGRKVLLLFEGWDECPQNCAIIHKIVDGQELPASSIIITSRYNSAGELYKKIDRGIELAVFSYSNRVEYIKKYFDSEEKSDSLISLLTNHPDLESLCSYPMMLSMICFIHYNDDSKALSTMTGVYDDFVCLVVNRYLREKKENSESEIEAALDVLKHTSLSGFHQYTKLALKGVQTHKFVFENEDLKKWDIQFDLTRDCEGIGIVLKYTQVNKKGCEGISYQFLHDSMQCFLAALEMSECTEEEQLQILKNCIKSLFVVYSTEEDEYSGQLGNHRYKQQYSEELELDSVQKYEPILSDPQSLMLQFFAGNTGLKNPEIASTLIEESRKGSHDQWCKSALPLILYESQNKELTKDIMREVLKPQIVVSCQDNFHLRCTAWCMAQAERKVEELTIILPKHIRLQHFLDTCDDLSSLKALNIRGSVCTSEILPIIKVMQQNVNVLKTLKFSISIEESEEKSETPVESEIEEMSRLICSLPALHELSIGSGSSQLTDKLTEKVLQQAVPQTWIGKVLSVESSSPATLKQAFASSQKLSSAKSQVILDSLHLIHYPSGNTDVQGSDEEMCALNVLKESQLKLLAIGSFPSACFSYHLMQDVATAAVQRKYKEPMMIMYDTVTPGSEEAKNIIHVCVHDQTTATAFHIYVAHVDHLHCFESSLEFSFIHLGKKVS
jgi:hypothetical protein